MLNASAVLSLAQQGNTDGIIDLCKQALLEEAAKAQGGVSLLKRTKAAQKMLKGIDEQRLPKAGAVSITKPDGATYQSFNNGHCGFMLTVELQGLPQGDPGKEPLDMGDYIANAERDMRVKQKMEVDLVAVRAFVAEHKATHKGKRQIPIPYWKMDTHFYNAQYIIDCYTILGGDVQFYLDPTRPLSGAILESENGKCLLLPVRPPKNDDERNDENVG